MERTRSIHSQVLLRSLETEERQWVRDLELHQGYQLVRQALEEHLQQARDKLENAKTSEDFLRLQAEVQALKKALAVPSVLLGSTPKPGGV